MKEENMSTGKPKFDKGRGIIVCGLFIMYLKTYFIWITQSVKQFFMWSSVA